MRPIFPSWIKSSNCKPRLVYFLAMETTRRRLASVSSFFACSASASPRRICVRVRFRPVSAALKPDDLALERMEPLDSVADVVHQPLLLLRVEVDRAEVLRHLDTGPRERVLGPQVSALLRFRGVFELGGLLESHLVELLDLVDDFEGLLGLVLDLLFG